MKNLFHITGFLNGLMMQVLSSLIVSVLLCAAYNIPYPGVMFLATFVLLFFSGLYKTPAGMLRVDVNNVSARMMYQNAIRLLNVVGDYEGRRWNIDESKIVMGDFRGEAPLDATNNTYNIPLIENARVGSERINNRLVLMQDILVVNQLSVRIGIGAATASNAKDYSYGNVTAFSTSGAAAALQTIYNGKLILLNNNTQVVPSWAVKRHYKVPAVQEIADLFYDGTAIQQDEIDLSTDTFYAVEPGWIINGAGKMQLQLVAGSAPAAIQANSFILVEGRGMLFKNVTPVV